MENEGAMFVDDVGGSPANGAETYDAHANLFRIHDLPARIPAPESAIYDGHFRRA
jgi:hypothetical protein